MLSLRVYKYERINILISCARMPAFGHKLSKAVLAFGVYGTILTRVLHYGTILFDDLRNFLCTLWRNKFRTWLRLLREWLNVITNHFFFFFSELPRWSTALEGHVSNHVTVGAVRRIQGGKMMKKYFMARIFKVNPFAWTTSMQNSIKKFF